MEIAQKFADNIKSEYINKIILFGSVARGEDDNNSDIDILIISSYNDKIRPKIREEIVNIILNDDELISPYIISQQQFDKQKNFSIYKNIMKEGIILGG